MSESKYIINNEILMKEWNWNKNINWQPENLTIGSKEKVWWKCEKGHEWQASVSNRTRGTGCPYCSGRQAIIGYNDLMTTHPDLAKEWSYEKNGDLKPDMVSANSGKKVWWKCKEGHEWQASIDNRARGTGCPFCGNKQVLEGYNDLATVNPIVAKEWNYKKNGDLKPNKIVANNGRKVWWKCNKGHEWQASIISRNRGTGCPYCANNKTLKNYNDLVTINPKLAKEWNYEKNGKLQPDMVSANSHKKVWWKCEKGHEWQAVISSRNNGIGCPICAKELQTSFPEQAIYFYIKKLFPDAINGDTHLKMELDIFIPSKNIAIEYDGIFWHKNLKSDERKNKLCRENKILLFRVKENIKEESVKNDYLRIIPCTYSDTGIKSAIELITKYLNKNIDVNLDRDRGLIYESFINNQKQQSLMIINPALSKEWNYEKNGELKPDMVTANSNKKVWWKCNKGHEWQAIIQSRNKGNGCPICANQQVLEGYNDLATVNPILAKEWNYEKNGELEPAMVTKSSEKKVWWKCNKGHEWQAKVKDRNSGNGCPICANQQVLKGYNDLATVNPTLTREWNYEENGELKPDMVTANSGKKVWWKCKKGHKWQANISDRTHGNGCPYCSNHRLLDGYNDLVTINPTLSKEWNYEKNRDLKPNMFMANSIKKVWWKCNKGHEWQASISNRNRGTGCPICKNKQVLKGYNDLITTNLNIAKEWNYEKNGELKPDMVTANSNKKVWWKCNKGHEWQAIIQSRNKGNGCPICANQQVLEGYNDLATVNPILAKEWNYEKNGELEPAMVTKSSEKKVWWKCNKGHEWQAKVKDRNSGNGCPICANQQVLKGYNDLATVNPTLTREWNYEENGELKPDMVTANSGKKVWWKCKKGHKWQANISDRTHGNGCPYCSNHRLLDGYNDLVTINPTLSKEWNYEKNRDLKPNMFMANSIKKVWWKCNKGHEWQASISNRNRGTGCPICKNKQVLKGYNDLITTNLNIAKEWNYEKNGELKPDMVTANSNKKVWWKCNKGHEWQAIIANRNKGRGCPICRKEQIK